MLKQPTYMIVVMSYNMPIESSEIYNRLINDGVLPKNITVIDNGSEKKYRSDKANFILPWNIRAAGQMDIALSYCIKYFPREYYITITTSAELSPDINYSIKLNENLKDMNNIGNCGFLAFSLKGVDAKKFPEQNFDELTDKYSVIMQRYQTIAIAWSDKLIREAYKKELGCFNPNIIRGWGMDFDFILLSYKLALVPYVTKDLHVIWHQNLGYKKSLLDEDLKTYRMNSKIECKKAILKTWGKNYFDILIYYRDGFLKWLIHKASKVMR